jgi:1-acyl-sn-glycerol-3-phosphate acyltransferase
MGMPLIQAQKRPLFEKMFFRYAVWLTRRSFAHVFIDVDASDVTSPITPHTVVPRLFICNHSSWWDGLFAFMLNGLVFGHDVYGMMSEAGLRKHPFFAKIGAFSINRHSPRDIQASLHYMVDLLATQDPEGRTRAVWLFPQGEVRPLDVRPLGFLGGLPWIVRTCNKRAIPCMVVPVSFAYVMGQEQYPVAYITVGKAVAMHQLDEAGSTLEACVTAQLDEVHTALRLGIPLPHTPLLAGKPSTGRPW